MRLITFQDTTAAKGYFQMGIKLMENEKPDSSNFYLNKAKIEFSRFGFVKREIDCLNLIGHNYRKLSQFNAAQQVFGEAYSLSKMKFGLKNLTTATCLHNTGMIADILGDYSTASKNLHQALEIRQALIKGDHPTIARNLSELAMVNFGEGNFDSAMNFIDQSLEIQLNILGEKHQDVAEGYNLKGVLYDNLGDLDQAITFYNKSLEIRKEISGENAPDVAQSYSNLGVVYGHKNAYHKALEFHEKSLKIRLKLFGKDHADVATSYNNLAIIFRTRGDFSKALEYYQRSLDIRRKIFGKTHPAIAASYVNMGITYSELENYYEAINYYKKALEIDQKLSGPNHPYVAGDYYNMAISYKEMGEYAQSLTTLKKALTIDQSNFGNAHPNIAENYTTTGMVYEKMGKYDLALNEYQKAISIYAKTIGQDNVRMAVVYQETGRVLLAQKQFEKALDSLDKSLAILTFSASVEDWLSQPTMENIMDQRALLISLFLRAQVFQNKGWAQMDSTSKVQDFNRAAETFTLISQLSDQLRWGISGMGSKMVLGKKNHKILEASIQNSLALFELTNHESYLEKALFYAEKNKAAILQDALQDLEAKKIAGIDESLLEKERDLKQEIAYLQNLIRKEKEQESGNEKIKEFQGKYFNLINELETLVEDLEADYPSYFQLKYQAPKFEVLSLQEKLEPKTLFLEFFIGENEIYLFYLDKENLRYFKTEKPIDFESSIQLLAKSLKSPDKKILFEESCYLYQLLLAEVLGQYKKGEIKKLIVIPDDLLNYIPFEILIQDQHPKKDSYQAYNYLIRDFEVAYHYSGSSLFHPLPRAEENDSFIGFAPIYSEANNENLLALNTSERSLLTSSPPLPYAQEEVESIAKLMEGIAVTGPEATEFQFKQKSPDHGIIHIASHTLINDENPMYSKLIFDAEHDTIENGLLNTYELYNMELNADLVALSACNTGIGKYYQGEGVMSLARGFLYAGVPNILMSMWPASDQSTKDIMGNFYKEIKKGNSKSRALRNAKLSYLKKADNITAAPYYWANFIFMGSPETIVREGTSMALLISGAFLFFIVAVFLYFIVKRKGKKSIPH
ncbi:CHAT domain-containing protein [Flexithrix dorotheae]|uniref:CHAT domain-containing protein n=1 Tax=Flexithrix dorotheae TaxID=70993 RepID=UPI0003A4F33A|nr:CHAT domain-containing tetratricopeptide repeat protein [Flexithrix dorotheae]